jgi:hypothetical protein
MSRLFLRLVPIGRGLAGAGSLAVRRPKVTYGPELQRRGALGRRADKAGKGVDRTCMGPFDPMAVRWQGGKNE